MRALQSLKGLGLACLLVLFAASTVRAANVGNWILGDLGLCFDPGGTEISRVVPTSSTFDLYLLARVPAGGISAYELVEPRFSPDHTMPVVLRIDVPAGSPFVKQEWADACSWAVAKDPGCPTTPGGIIPLIHYRLQYMETDPIVVLTGFQCPTIAGPVASEFHYESCDEPGRSKTLTIDWNQSSVFLDGREIVPVDDTHWGMFKSRFGRQ